MICILVGGGLVMCAGCGSDEAAPVELEEYTNSIGMTFKLVPAGEYQMGNDKQRDALAAEIPGSSPSDFGREDPAHPVRITKPFFLCAKEVTQEQYQKVVGSNPAENSSPQNPVENVSWTDAELFCKRLSEKEKRTYRLPTEAEWEYACRAGSTTEFHFGDDPATLPEHAWFAGNSGKKSHPVGEKKPNAWGFLDMNGNVSEWCQDWFAAEYYESSEKSDPKGPYSGSGRVHRGGSFESPVAKCRSTPRFKELPTYKSPALGFRVVLEPE
jgi:formylglycine-generating enzyme required for sulfatase activity